MKKFFLVAVMGALLFVGLTSMVSMDPPDNTTCNEQCEFFVDIGLFSGQGACMAPCNVCLNPSENITSNFAVCICLQIKDIEGFEAAGFKNMGDCVNTLKGI